VKFVKVPGKAAEYIEEDNDSLVGPHSAAPRFYAGALRMAYRLQI